MRYALGTVIGGVIFFFLCNTNPVLRQLIFGANAQTLTAPLLLLLGAYGLAFCYFASAPVLVLHTARFFLSTHFVTKRLWLHLSVMLAIPLALTVIFFCATKTTGSARWLYTFVLFIGSFIIWIQYVLIGVALKCNFELYTFYINLASRRRAAIGDIVGSYRHLREHGNAFLIVLCEIVLAILLYIWGNFYPAINHTPPAQNELYVIPYLLIILVWVVPAALVWVVASLIERRFSGNLP